MPQSAPCFSAKAKRATSAPRFPILLCRADIDLDLVVLARNHISCTTSDIIPRYIFSLAVPSVDAPVVLVRNHIACTTSDIIRRYALSFAVPSVDAPIASQYFSHIGGMVTCTSYRAPRPPDGTTMKTRGGNRDASSARCAASASGVPM